jgi:drug/metabolite transporter (DMT)-like permease
VALALGVGACIAGYTLVDNAGIEHASALSYLEAVLVVPALAYLAMTASRRGRPSMRAEFTPATALAGAGVVGAYALTLAALERASAAPVAAARETSIVVATLLGALVLREPVGRLSFAGSVVIVLGVAAIALG